MGVLFLSLNSIVRTPAFIRKIIAVNLMNEIVFQTNLSEKKTVDINRNDQQKKKNKIKRCNCFVKVKLRS